MGSIKSLSHHVKPVYELYNKKTSFYKNVIERGGGIRFDQDLFYGNQFNENLAHLGSIYRTSPRAQTLFPFDKSSLPQRKPTFSNFFPSYKGRITGLIDSPTLRSMSSIRTQLRPKTVLSSLITKSLIPQLRTGLKPFEC